MTMQILSPKLGQLEIDVDLLLTFPEGIPGFHEIKEYALIEHGEESPFFWLQAISDPGLSFVVTNPLIFMDNYTPGIPSDALQLLEADDVDSLLTVAIVTIPHEDPNKATVNLMAPICINPFNRKGRQVILHQSEYSHQEPLFQKKLP